MAKIGKVTKRTKVNLSAEYLEAVIDMLRIRAENPDGVRLIADGLEATVRFRIGCDVRDREAKAVRAKEVR